MVVGPGLMSDSTTFGRSFDVSQNLKFFFSGIKIITPGIKIVMPGSPATCTIQHSF